MLRTVFFLCLLLLLCAGFASADIVKIRVDDTIQPISDEYIGRAIEHARQTNADAVLIELNTPGGLRRLHALHHFQDSGLARAGNRVRRSNRSARRFGRLLHSGIRRCSGDGAGNQCGCGPSRRPRWREARRRDEDETGERFCRLHALVRGPAGRNVQLAESAVRESKSWSDQEALQQHLIDVVAPDDDALFKQLEGRTIKRFDGKAVVLHLAGKHVEELPMTVRQRVLDFLLDPNIAFLVLAVGALALYAEFNHLGAILPGVVGVVFILLALFALNLLPTRYAAFTLILAAFLLFALEAKFATHGILGLGGIALLTVGGLLLVDRPIPQMRVKLWVALSVSVPLGAITIFLMTIALRARHSKVVTGEKGMIGAIGEARTDIDPEGKVMIGANCGIHTRVAASATENRWSYARSKGWSWKWRRRGNSHR